MFRKIIRYIREITIDKLIPLHREKSNKKIHTTVLSREQYLLIKLGEEAVELSQRASKSLCFGSSEVQTGQEFTNTTRIHQEYNDLIAVVTLLNREFGYYLTADPKLINAKIEKIEKYYDYSVSQGTAEPRK